MYLRLRYVHPAAEQKKLAVAKVERFRNNCLMGFDGNRWRTSSRRQNGRRGSGELMDRSAKYLKSLVGASGFEPEASCAQARRATSGKSFLFNLSFENKRVRKIFCSGTMYRNVAAHAWSPPNFPHSEITAKVLRSLPTSR